MHSNALLPPFSSSPLDSSKRQCVSKHTPQEFGMQVLCDRVSHYLLDFLQAGWLDETSTPLHHAESHLDWAD
jgi:uncharacterized protein (DUF2237 family)